MDVRSRKHSNLSGINGRHEILGWCLIVISHRCLMFYCDISDIKDYVCSDYDLLYSVGFGR